MNSIPLVARKMGEVTAAAKRKSAESFSFPIAIKVSPDAIETVKTINSPRFIRLIMDFMDWNFKMLNH